MKALGPVIPGGEQLTFLNDETLEYADFVMRGEGDHSLVELIPGEGKEGMRSVRSHFSIPIIIPQICGKTTA